MSANSLDFNCDWSAGFNLQSSFKGTVGYLLAWSGCGGINLKTDITVWNPFDASTKGIVKGEKVKCIGLISEFQYEGGENDPIRVVCYVSKDTASEMRSRLARPLSNTKLKLSWYIIDFDSERKKWFDAAFVKGNKKAEANIDSAGGDLQVFVEKEPTKISETLDLNVYRFEFQVVPADKKSSVLEFATGPTQKLVKKWAG